MTTDERELCECQTPTPKWQRVFGLVGEIIMIVLATTGAIALFDGYRPL